MAENDNDTVRLLRECGAGAKMGVEGIDDVVDQVQNDALRALLKSSRARHEQLGGRAVELLGQIGGENKQPPAMARTMSAMKTGMKMLSGKPDAAAADLICDGCGMGIKSLAKYLNQYPAAHQDAKNVTTELIAVEERLAKDVRPYL